MSDQCGAGQIDEHNPNDPNCDYAPVELGPDESRSDLEIFAEKVTGARALVGSWLEGQPGDIDRHYAARRLAEALGDPSPA